MRRLTFPGLLRQGRLENCPFRPARSQSRSGPRIRLYLSGRVRRDLTPICFESIPRMASKSVGFVDGQNVHHRHTLCANGRYGDVGENGGREVVADQSPTYSSPSCWQSRSCLAAQAGDLTIAVFGARRRSRHPRAGRRPRSGPGGNATGMTTGPTLDDEAGRPFEDMLPKVRVWPSDEPTRASELGRDSAKTAVALGVELKS